MRNTGYIVWMILCTVAAASYAHALCVCVPDANVRAGPGTDYPVVWNVVKYMRFVKVGVSLTGDWYAVRDVDGEVHWIHKRLVTDTYRCTTVRAEQVNVRTGPGTRYPKSTLSPAYRYYTYRVLQRKGPWVHLKDLRGATGWIHSKYLWLK